MDGSLREYFSILEIEPTENIRIIKSAYAKKLKALDKITDKETYQLIRGAYKNLSDAIGENAPFGNSKEGIEAYAHHIKITVPDTETLSTLTSGIEPVLERSLSGVQGRVAFIFQYLEEIYADPVLRINKRKWFEILSYIHPGGMNPAQWEKLHHQLKVFFSRNLYLDRSVYERLFYALDDRYRPQEWTAFISQWLGDPSDGLFRLYVRNHLLEERWDYPPGEVITLYILEEHILFNSIGAVEHIDLLLCLLMEKDVVISSGGEFSKPVLSHFDNHLHELMNFPMLVMEFVVMMLSLKQGDYARNWLKMNLASSNTLLVAASEKLQSLLLNETIIDQNAASLYEIPGLIYYRIFSSVKGEKTRFKFTEFYNEQCQYSQTTIERRYRDYFFGLYYFLVSLRSRNSDRENRVSSSVVYQQFPSDNISTICMQREWFFCKQLLSLDYRGILTTLKQETEEYYGYLEILNGYINNVAMSYQGKTEIYLTIAERYTADELSIYAPSLLKDIAFITMPVDANRASHMLKLCRKNLSDKEKDKFEIMVLFYSNNYEKLTALDIGEIKDDESLVYIAIACAILNLTEKAIALVERSQSECLSLTYGNWEELFSSCEQACENVHELTSTLNVINSCLHQP